MRSRSRWPDRAVTTFLAVVFAVAPALAQTATSPGQPSGDAWREAGRRLFTGGASPPCALCHTLKDASAAGEIGPSLDQLRPDAGRVAKALRDGLGPMPSYRERLSDEQLEALARYVSQVAGE